jgi:hypothetical protein
MGFGPFSILADSAAKCTGKPSSQQINLLPLLQAGGLRLMRPESKLFLTYDCFNLRVQNGASRLFSAAPNASCERQTI